MNNTNDYENKMVEAFIDKPEKTVWYQNSFKKYQVNGIDRVAWNWSWWAFFGGFFFLLYRKAYMAALGLFVISLLASWVPILPFIVSILTGGYATYFIFKNYSDKKKEVESSIQDTQTRIDTMRELGGYNNWAIWLAAILYGIIVIAVIASVAIPEVQPI
ncbi:MAG: DUF2628 domain-containing protein [Sulfurovum sp.]|nr:DUF2628 domain-containing protein [Sulfurovum sp.]